jgi:hypothetical protein
MGLLDGVRGGRQTAWHGGKRRAAACLTDMGEEEWGNMARARWAGWLAGPAQGKWARWPMGR